jgi:hypothetical protein
MRYRREKTMPGLLRSHISSRRCEMRELRSCVPRLDPARDISIRNALGSLGGYR